MTDVRNTQTNQDAQPTPAAQPTPDAQPTQNAQATSNTPSAPDLNDKARPLDDLIASIHAAVAPGASAEARAFGATACRSILSALEAKAGQPLTTAPPTATPATSPLTTLLTQLAAMPREQMLEFITNFLRSKLPPGTQTQVTTGPRFHLIQIPPAIAPTKR